MGRPTRPRQTHLPSFERQQVRLDGQWIALQEAFEAGRARMQADATGIVPEQVLVFETVGSIEKFQAAVRRVEGLEWLAEWEGDEIPSDEDFYVDEEHRNKPLDGRLFLTSTDRRGLEAIARLWSDYQASEGKRLPHSFGKWRDLFSQLRQVRFWDTEDRLRDTGLLENLQFDLAHTQDPVRIEAELWFYTTPEERSLRVERLRSRISEDGGRVLAEREIEEAGYSGVLFELPAPVASTLLNGSYDLLLLRDSAVMYFRPTGQTIVPVPVDAPVDAPLEVDSRPSGNESPVVALLDGLPLANHGWLDGSVVVDDPDGWEANYPVNVRSHGTAMASLIVRGDAGSNGESLAGPIYARPVMRPKPTWAGRFEEAIPDNELPLDLLHRAFRRMFESEGGSAPAAPSIRIVNFSLGDKARPFDRSVSSWARLFDWLSWHYNVLILVSAGNFVDNVELDVTLADLEGMASADLERRVIAVAAEKAAQRRILVPAEAINALTVGAVHEDDTTVNGPDNRIDCYVTSGMPSPINRLGLGYRRAIKPEIYLPGGRQLYQPKPGAPTEQAVLQIAAIESRAPGHPVAAPGQNPGELTGMLFKRGTSNATALASRAAAQLLETLYDLGSEPGGEALLDECIPTMLKTLLVHGSRWTGGYDSFKATLASTAPAPHLNYSAERFVGYGRVDLSRVRTSTDQRATVIGCGIFEQEGAHQFTFPLPISLNRRRDWRRLIITLAWLTPINPRRQTYRKAALTFSPTAAQLSTDVGVRSRDADGNAAKRGTVQHQVFEGHASRDFLEGDAIKILVNCREEAGALNGERVPYALAVTLEVAEALDVPIYDEILLRIRQPIRVPTST
jgi:hypothetical protein